jgi:hypothetical protein
MLVNSAIHLNDGTTIFEYFQTPEKASEWMKQHHGSFTCVETDFLHPWEIENKIRKDDPIYDKLYHCYVYSRRRQG